jgi:hypothetical protein
VSDEDPQCEIKSSKTDHIAMHKGSALKKAARLRASGRVCGQRGESSHHVIALLNGRKERVHVDVNNTAEVRSADGLAIYGGTDDTMWA